MTHEYRTDYQIGYDNAKAQTHFHATYDFETLQGFYVTRGFNAAKFSKYYPTAAEATEDADDMNATESQYLTEIIESEIAKYSDFTGLGGDGILATRIAAVVMKAFYG